MAASLTATSPLPGLSTQEAAARLRQDGPNELPAARPRTNAAIAWDVVSEPMFVLLIATGAVYVLLGDFEESLALLAAIGLVIGITLYQEHKTERALEALRDLSSPRALVIRDGVATRIAGRDVVRGDLVVVREGDRVPADANVESSSNLLVDESLLTGESVAVRKRAGVPPIARESPGGDDRPFVYSGTLVVRGDGTARVYAVGAATALGTIGAALNRVEIGRTALQREVARMVRLLAVAGLGACVLVGVVYAGTRHAWLDGALAGLTLAISMVPEEFPVVLTVFLALGAWRISRRRVLTRRIPAVETLGSATVLCVDKTGTLTMNRMTVAALAIDAERLAIAPPLEGVPAPFIRLIASAALASKPDAFDPMEHAIVECARELRADAPDRSRLAREYPLSDALLAVTQAWRRIDAPDFEIATKGAPEAVLALCRLTPRARADVMDQVNSMAADGLRVIGVGRARWLEGRLPETPTRFDFDFIGLVGLADPVRPGVAAAIEECQTARIRVVMMTGDYPATALNIARQIGLARTSSCLTGRDLAAMGEEELRRRVRDVDVFARIMPEQKLRLVSALKGNGEVVAMTGDGVNDAPALKAADIGIAMGARGTDVAREAAALVLLDDDFTSIVRAVRLGRRIYTNIEKAMAYVLAIHVPIAGLSLIPLLAGWPLVLLPVHVIFMELIVDPACSVAFEMEPEDRDVMRRPPREPRRRLFTRRLVARSLLQGAGACAAAALVFAAAARSGAAEADVRALTFSTLIVGNLVLIATNRSLSRPIWTVWREPNPAFRWLIAGALVLLAAVLYLPPLRDLFRVTPLHPADVAIVAGAGAAALAWTESVKRVLRTS